MLFALPRLNLKRSVKDPVARAELTTFHIVSVDGLGAPVNEEEIPRAIVMDAVHSSEQSRKKARTHASMEFSPPAPVFLALSFLLALAVFFSAD